MLREGRCSKTQKSALWGCQPQSGHWGHDKRTKEGTTCRPGSSLKSHTKTPTWSPVEKHPGHSPGDCLCHQQDQGSHSEGNRTFLLRSTKGFNYFIFQVISCQAKDELGLNPLFTDEEKRSVKTKATLKIKRDS